MYVYDLVFNDFNGKKKEVDLHFNLTQKEVIDLNFEIDGGLEAYISEMTKTEDAKKVAKFLDKLVLASYGKVLEDGTFDKSEETLKAFTNSKAYSDFFMALIKDADKAAEFVNGILPDEFVAAAEEKKVTAIAKTDKK